MAVRDTTLDRAVARRRPIAARVVRETLFAVLGSGGICFLVYALVGLPIPASGTGGVVMMVAPFATPLLVAPIVALPFARASQRVVELLAEVDRTRRALAAEVAERVLAQERLEELARRDPLTGLLNRRGFFALGEVVERPLAVMVVDVDQFKAVNDGWGHAAGDAVLARIAALLEAAAPSAEVARLGGDELVLVAGARQADELARAAQAVTAVRVECPGQPELTVSCTVGTVVVEAGASMDEALAAADAAMYEAKRRRPAAVRLAGPGPSEVSARAGRPAPSRRPDD